MSQICLKQHQNPGPDCSLRGGADKTPSGVFARARTRARVNCMQFMNIGAASFDKTGAGPKTWGIRAQDSHAPSTQWARQLGACLAMPCAPATDPGAASGHRKRASRALCSPFAATESASEASSSPSERSLPKARGIWPRSIRAASGCHRGKSARSGLKRMKRWHQNLFRSPSASHAPELPE